MQIVRFDTPLAGQHLALGILAGSFNPPTIAHAELARAAESHVDRLLFVAPSALPHKPYFGATLEQRIEMLSAMLSESDLAQRSSVATTERGLFIEIAREVREACGPETRLYFVCGRDAAERILNWDYGRPGVVDEMLNEFELLVAPRGGHLRPPAGFSHRIHSLDIRAGHDEVSSTQVRERIAHGQSWEHLVPENIVERVRAIYS
jgi:nicotinate (nicotinamide) nucleotide adenylyltransferase